MQITIRRPNGDKIWEYTVQPNMNLPRMAAEEDGSLHVAGLEQYPIIRPPWKIEIEPIKWEAQKGARDMAHGALGEPGAAPEINGKERWKQEANSARERLDHIARQQHDAG